MWANIIILLIGIGNIKSYIGTSPNHSSSEKNIKVLTYNVRLFNKYNWLILCLVGIISVAARHYFNLRGRNIHRLYILISSIVALIVLAVLLLIFKN